MRQEDEIDVAGVEVLLAQTVEKQGDAGVCPGIDESAPATFNNQMARVLQRPEILRIDGNDAIVECGDVRVTSQAWWSPDL